MHLHLPEACATSETAQRPRWASPGRPTALALLLWSMGAVWAQEDAPPEAIRPAWQVTPRISVSETFTDNVDLSEQHQRSEQITEISPGIRLSHEGGRVSGYFDYALRALAYAQSSHEASYLNALSTAGEVDVADQWLLVDFSGNISQSALSALGPLAGVGGYSPTNSTEVSRYSVAPFVQGTLGQALDYNARFSRTITHANSSLASDVGESLGSINLASSNSLSRLGWVADASRYNVDYSAGRATEADQVDVGLRLAITPQLKAVAKVGREYSNYTTREKQGYATGDLSLEWQTTAQLRASGSWGRRSFGDIHAASLLYQTPLISVSLADRRDVSAVPGQLVPVLFLPASAPPVPAPGAGLPFIGYFVTTALAVQDRQELQLSVQGVRDTLTLGYSQSIYTRLDTLSGLSDVLARSSLRQDLASVGLKHRLTPLYDLELLAAAQKAAGASDQENTVLRQVALNLTGKISRQGRASIGLRHAASTGDTRYQENALTLGLQVEF